jgi:hypothetical protein
MASVAQAKSGFFRVAAPVAAKLLVVNFKVGHRFTELASPVPPQHSFA